jgi:hypothetical protein
MMNTRRRTTEERDKERDKERVGVNEEAGDDED